MIFDSLVLAICLLDLSALLSLHLYLLPASCVRLAAAALSDKIT
jgi:hypothetical protein